MISSSGVSRSGVMKLALPVVVTHLRSSSLSVCAAKKSAPVRFGVISHAVALTPFSQYSNGCGLAGLALKSGQIVVFKRVYVHQAAASGSEFQTQI